MVDNMFGVESGLALSKVLSAFSNLSDIYLSYLNFVNEGSTAVANALKESAPSLEVLEMAGNEITAKAAPALAACTASKQLLVKLNLADNELKDEGAILISKALEVGHTQLHEIDTNTNLTRRAGARCLAQVVASKPSLKLLNINGDYISDEGIDDVKDLFKNFPMLLGHWMAMISKEEIMMMRMTNKVVKTMNWSSSSRVLKSNRRNKNCSILVAWFHYSMAFYTFSSLSE